MSIKGDHLQFSKTTENFAFCRQSSITSCVLVENAAIAPAVTILHQSLKQFVFTNSVIGWDSDSYDMRLASLYCRRIRNSNEQKSIELKPADISGGK